MSFNFDLISVAASHRVQTITPTGCSRVHRFSTDKSINLGFDIGNIWQARRLVLSHNAINDMQINKLSHTVHVFLSAERYNLECD